MKKVIISLICAGMLIGSMPLDGAVSKMRAVKCSLSRFHTKFNCTEEEKAVGKKWLVGASVAAALAALAALVVGGVKLAEVQAEKKRIEQQRINAEKKYVAVKENPKSFSGEDIVSVLVWTYLQRPTRYKTLSSTIAREYEALEKTVTNLSLYPRAATKEKEEAKQRVLQDLKPQFEKDSEKKYREQQKQYEQQKQQSQYRGQERQREENLSEAEMLKNNVRIENQEVKSILGLDKLGLDKNKSFFKWYEIFGFSTAPSKAEALRTFRRLSLQYHPDKHPNQPIYNELMQALTQAKTLMG